MRYALASVFLLVGGLWGGWLPAAEVPSVPRVLSTASFHEQRGGDAPTLLADFYQHPAFPFILDPDERVVTLELGAMSAAAAQRLLDAAFQEHPHGVTVVRLTGSIDVTSQPLSLPDKTCVIFEAGGQLVAASSCTATALLLVRDRQFVSIKGRADPRVRREPADAVMLNGRDCIETAILIERSGRVHLDQLSLAGCRGDGIRVRGQGVEKYHSPVSLTRSRITACQGNGVVVGETPAFIVLDTIIDTAGQAGLAIDAPSSIVANVCCMSCQTGVAVTASNVVLTRNQMTDNNVGIRLAAPSRYSLVYENRIERNAIGLVLRGADATVGWNAFANTTDVDGNGGGKGNTLFSNSGLAAGAGVGRGVTMFDPPTAANRHQSQQIWKAEDELSAKRSRIDLKIEAGAEGMSVGRVNDRLKSARAEYPEAVLVVRLVGDFFLRGNDSLQLPGLACVILDGQIIRDESAGDSEKLELIELKGEGCVSFSGGRVVTAGRVFSVVSAADAKNVLLIEGVACDLRPGSGGRGASPVNAISSKKHRGPFVIRDCEVSTTGHRGIWAHVSKRVYALGNTCRAENFTIDFDAYCFNSAALFNHVTGNERHSGVFFEECVKENIAFANQIEESKVHGISMWTEAVTGVTEKNVVACNSVRAAAGMKPNGSGLAVGGRSAEKTSANNYFFNNRLEAVQGRGAIFLRQHSSGNYFAESVVQQSETPLFNLSTKPESERFQPQAGFHSAGAEK